MRILLTGGSGFVGSAFLTSINTADHEVVCLGRSKITGLGSNTRFITTDICDKKSVVRAAEMVGDPMFDALIHMAAYVPRNSQEDVLDSSEAINIRGTIHILEAFKGRLKKIVIGSTVEVYDQTEINGAINESSTVGPGSYYASTKLGSEFISRTFGLKHKIPVSVLRFSVMYGPNDPINRALPNFIKQALRNERIEVNAGAPLRDYIHIDDVVASIHHAILSSTSEGTINIGTGFPVSIEKAARDIVRIAGSTSEIIVTEHQTSVDIVIDTSHAKDLLDFDAKYHFPDNLDEMIDSYR